MKLLIVTQKVDRIDPILGFFHEWIAAFSQSCTQVTVIAQVVGSHSFAGTVTVHSLGKQDGSLRLSQVFLFWKLLWTQRNNYDCVLVHMTPIWIVLGAPIWFLCRKRMYLWYEARGARWPLRVAVRCVRTVFSASSAGMPLKTKKSMIVGHGIDTQKFAQNTQVAREHGLLVTVGRVTRSKNLDVLLKCLRTLPEEYHLVIVGTAITDADKDYVKQLQSSINESDLRRRIAIQSLPHDDVIAVLRRAEVFVHASDTSLDKALLEAMAAGCLVVSSSEAGRLVLPKECQSTKDTMAETIQSLVALSDTQKDSVRKKLRDTIEEHHGLQRLIARLCGEMKG